ncbi:MAG: hypothetical protein R3C53_26980 [Pirellulaceae bacterium]
MPRTPPWLMSLIEEHFEELQMLWELRLAAARDADYQAEDLRELDERIAAHLDGLVISQEHALPLVIEGLGGGERPVVFAAVLSLLHFQNPVGLQAMWAAFDQVEGEAADGFIDAFGVVSIADYEPALVERLTHESSVVATVAAQILAFAGRLPTDYPRVAELVVDDDEDVRRRGWDIVSMIGR